VTDRAWRQLAIPFEHRAALGEEDFLVSEGSREAVAWIDRWPDWPSHALAIHGPAGCGKSHLAQVWRRRAAARVVPAAALAATRPDRLLGAAKAVAVEDADRGTDERAMLHLHNLVREEGGHLLLTGRQAPARWRIALPDLASRLAAMPAVAVGRPDDDLIAAVLIKQFDDRQLRVPPEVIGFLVRRMERSFAAIAETVAALDSLSLAERRNITTPLARRVLDRLRQTEIDLGD